MKTTISIKVPIYTSEIDIRLYDAASIIKDVSKEYDITITEDDINGCDGIAYDMGEFCKKYGNFLIIIPDFEKTNKLKRVSILVHELLHVTNMILADKGITVSQSDDEVQAYLFQYIFTEVSKELRMFK